MTADRWLALAQGVYFLISGVWPLIHMPSFLRVTGPKVDLWLVKTVGALIAVIGGTLILAGWHGEITTAMRFLGIYGALSLMVVDLNYSLKGVIPKVYLLDALPEALIVLAWIFVSTF